MKYTKEFLQKPFKFLYLGSGVLYEAHLKGDDVIVSWVDSDGEWKSTDYPAEKVIQFLNKNSWKVVEEPKVVVSAKDKIYTGKVSEWELPDGTVMECVTSYGTWSDLIEGDTYTIHQKEDGIKQYIGRYSEVRSSFEIQSLPSGYEFNEAGEIVEVDSKESDKRYWDGEEPLENGMIVQVHKKELEFIGKNSNGSYVCLVEGTWDDYRAFHFGDLKPIDSRTDKEKLVDKYIDKYVEVQFLSDTPLFDVLSDFYDELVGKDE